MANKQIIYIDDVEHEVRESKIDFTGVAPGSHVLKVEYYLNDVLQDTAIRNFTVEAVAQAIPNDHHYNFNETSGGLIDQTGSANGSVLGSVVRGVPGVLNNAYDFNGSNSYVSIPGLNDEFTGSFSVAAWVNFDQLPTSFVRILQIRGGGSAGTKQGWQISVDDDDYQNTVIDDGDGNSISFNDVPLSAVADTWILYCLTWDTTTGTATFYIDAVQASQKTNAAMSNKDLTGEDFEIGRASNDAQYINADIDEVYTYKGVWTPQEIADYYNATKPEA